MFIKDLDSVPIGSIIAEPILVGGHAVYQQGTYITEGVKTVLKKLGITSIPITDNVGENLRQFSNSSTKLNNMSLIALRKLDIDAITITVRDIVKDTVNKELDDTLNTIYAYDEDTKRHCVNVANLALIFGIKDALPITYIKRLILGALLHDIGKTIIPETILFKEGKLTDKEMSLIRQHSVIGYNMIRDLKNIDPIVKRIVLEHHENWNGTGYPYGKSGLEVHKLSRIVHICDVYEAMCSARVYKPALMREDVRTYISTQAGNMLDPIIANKFLEYIPEFLIGEELLLDGELGVVTQSGKSTKTIISLGNKSYRFSEVKQGKVIEPYSTLV